LEKDGVNVTHFVGSFVSHINFKQQCNQTSTEWHLQSKNKQTKNNLTKACSLSKKTLLEKVNMFSKQLIKAKFPSCNHT